MGLSIYFGIKITVNYFGIEMLKVIVASFLLNFAFLNVGDQASNVPSVSKAKESAIPVFSIIDEESTLDIRKSPKESEFELH